MPKKGPSFDSQVRGFSTEELLRAYQGERNPLNYNERVSPGGQGNVAAVLKERGVDLSGVQVTPGGKINKPGLAGIGQKIGGVLKTVAPIATLAIPGLGPLAAGALAFGGRQLGGILQGQNGLKALPGNLLAGAATGAGKFALGKVGGLLKGGGGAGGAPGAVASGGGIGGTLRGIGQGLGVLGPNGQLNPLRLAQLGLGAAGVIQGAKSQGRANQALGRAVAPINVPMPDLSPIFRDPNNPYQQQTGPNGAQLAALQALRSR